MHDQHVGRADLEALVCQPEQVEEFAGRGYEAAGHALFLLAQRHDGVAVLKGFIEIVEDVTAPLVDIGGEQGGRGAQADLCAENVQQADIRAGDARVKDVADDQDALAAHLAPVLSQGEAVQEGLGRVLMHAVAGIDHSQSGPFREEARRAGRRMAHHHDVRTHGRQRASRVRQALALRRRGVGDGEIHHIGAQPLARHLERALGAGRSLEEEVQHRQPLEHIARLVRRAVHRQPVGSALEDDADVDGIEIGHRDQVAVGEVVGKCGAGHPASRFVRPRKDVCGGIGAVAATGKT